MKRSYSNLYLSSLRCKLLDYFYIFAPFLVSIIFYERSFLRQFIRLQTHMTLRLSGFFNVYLASLVQIIGSRLSRGSRMINFYVKLDFLFVWQDVDSVIRVERRMRFIGLAGQIASLSFRIIIRVLQHASGFSSGAHHDFSAQISFLVCTLRKKRE